MGGVLTGGEERQVEGKTDWRRAKAQKRTRGMDKEFDTSAIGRRGRRVWTGRRGRGRVEGGWNY